MDTLTKKIKRNGRNKITNLKKMKTVDIPNLTFDQLVELVKQLTKQEKIKLSKVLEKE